jgi:serine/threonine protein kinase
MICSYLHHCATPHIIHQDIKASNILLDADFKARVADFGLAKLIPEGASTNVKGSLGYLSSEYAMHGKASESYDVYSFGVLLLELISGKKPIEKLDSMQKVAITDWALPLVKDGNFSEIVDSRLNGDYVEGELKRLVLIALICAQKEPEKRLTMLEVAALLRGEMKEKIAMIENDEMFRVGSNANSKDTEVLDEKSDCLPEESVEEVKEAKEMGQTEI